MEHIEALHLQFRAVNLDTPAIEGRLMHIQAEKAWFRPIILDNED